VGRIVLSDDDLETDERPPSVLMSLPAELTEWAWQNREMVMRIQTALTESYATLSDEQVWEAIAAAASPEWKKARRELDAAETRWNELNSPENAPLGAIGLALDSDENNSARAVLDVSLSHFTIINEGLRKREDLGRLLNVLLVQKRMLEQSTENTRTVQKSAAVFDSLLSLRDDFHAAARKRSRLRRHFGQIAEKILNPEKEEMAKTVIVPWSPKTLS
jgi:hypothetical protein